MADTQVHQAVREKYGEIAKTGGQLGCCGPTACGCGDPITANLYSDAETADLPPEALAVSLGCGNPTALIQLEPGQTVLDLGSGGGIDVLLSAKRVGPSGKVYGLDMTDEMLALARENQRKAGATNVEFLKGTIEAIPLPDRSVDVIVSNCVINLSPDKDAVLREAFRVPETRGPLRRRRRRRAGRGTGRAASQSRNVGRMRRRRSAGHRIRLEASSGGIRGHRSGSVACLQRRRCARVSDAKRAGCRLPGRSDRRPCRQRVHPGAKTGGGPVLRPRMLLAAVFVKGVKGHEDHEEDSVQIFFMSFTLFMPFMFSLIRNRESPRERRGSRSDR